MDPGQDLISSARCGDRDAMLQLLLDFQQQLGRFVSIKLSQQHDSEFTVDDIIQETAYKAFQNADSLRAQHKGEFYSWLKTIAQNLIADKIRLDQTAKRGGAFKKVNNARNDFEGRATDLISELSGDGFSPSQFAAKREAIGAMQIAINALPEDQRRAIELHCFERRSLEETAKVMERTAASVHGLIQRAKKNLREMMHRSSMWLSRKT